MKVVLIVLATIAGLALLLVGGCFAAGLWYFGRVEEIVQAHLESNTEFVERVGEVTELDVDFGSGNAFNFVGSKSKGQVRVPGISVNEKGGMLSGDVAIVVLDDGTTFEVPFDDRLVERQIQAQFEPEGSGESTEDPEAVPAGSDATDNEHAEPSADTDASGTESASGSEGSEPAVNTSSSTGG